MGRGPATFRQRDLAAALKAVVAAGHEVVRIEIGLNGQIIIVLGKLGDAAPAPDKNKWDE